MKELWCYTGNRISVRFGYEWRDSSDDLKRNLGYNTEINEAKEDVIKSIDEFESRILDYLPKLDH
jgi:nuclear transport factor 2 (NTF2) superfamily protein